jgi:4-hydroxyproline epimerase
MKTKPITKKYPNSSLDRFGGWTFHCIDAHTCGNPVRLVAEGGPELEGNTMSEKRQHFLKEFDWIRKRPDV